MAKSENVPDEETEGAFVDADAAPADEAAAEAPAKKRSAYKVRDRQTGEYRDASDFEIANIRRDAHIKKGLCVKTCPIHHKPCTEPKNHGGMCYCAECDPAGK